MLTPERVPIEVMNAFNAALLHGESYDEAIAAAINAWPGIQLSCLTVEVSGRKVILPLPQEAGDE